LRPPPGKPKLPVGLLDAVDASVMAAEVPRHRQWWQRSQNCTETGCWRVYVWLLLRWAGERGTAARGQQRAQLKNGQAVDYATLCPYGGHPKEGSERLRGQQQLDAARVLWIRACLPSARRATPRQRRPHPNTSTTPARAPQRLYPGSLEPPRAARADKPSSGTQRRHARTPHQVRACARPACP
jgi:hypothetical protein